MHTLRIRLPGNFYDSQIYDNALYLWCVDGSIVTLNWESLVQQVSIRIDPSLKIAAYLVLEDGRDLYHNRLMQDPEVKNLIQRRLEDLSRFRIELTNRDLQSCKLQQQDNPFPFPHTDLAFHEKRLYVSSQEGISHSMSKKITSEKLLDTPTVSLDIANYKLAIAAGDEGLFYYSLKSSVGTKPISLSSSECNLTRWMYPNIFMSSYTHLGSLARFQRVKNTPKNDINVKGQNVVKSSNSNRKDSVLLTLERSSPNSASQDNDNLRFLEMIPSENLFQTTLQEDPKKRSDVQFIWGVKDKVYWAREKGITVVKVKADSSQNKKDLIG